MHCLTVIPGKDTPEIALFTSRATHNPPTFYGTHLFIHYIH